eukprot:gene26277-31742_t
MLCSIVSFRRYGRRFLGNARHFLPVMKSLTLFVLLLAHNEQPQFNLIRQAQTYLRFDNDGLDRRSSLANFVASPSKSHADPHRRPEFTTTCAGYASTGRSLEKYGRVCEFLDQDANALGASSCHLLETFQCLLGMSMVYLQLQEYTRAEDCLGQAAVGLTQLQASGAAQQLQKLSEQLLDIVAELGHHPASATREISNRTLCLLGFLFLHSQLASNNCQRGLHYTELLAAMGNRPLSTEDLSSLLLPGRKESVASLNIKQATHGPIKQDTDGPREAITSASSSDPLAKMVPDNSGHGIEAAIYRGSSFPAVRGSSAESCSAKTRKVQSAEQASRKIDGAHQETNSSPSSEKLAGIAHNKAGQGQEDTTLPNRSLPLGQSASGNNTLETRKSKAKEQNYRNLFLVLLMAIAVCYRSPSLTDLYSGLSCSNIANSSANATVVEQRNLTDTVAEVVVVKESLEPELQKPQSVATIRLVSAYFDWAAGRSLSSVGTVQSLGLHNSFTVSVWLKMKHFNLDKAAQLDKVENNNCLNLSVRNGQPYIFFYGADSREHHPLLLDKWYNVALVYDQGKQQQLIYVDGVLACSTSAAKPVNSLHPIYLSEYSAKRGLQGDMAGIRIFRKALTAADISEARVQSLPQGLLLAQNEKGEWRDITPHSLRRELQVVEVPLM